MKRNSNIIVSALVLVLFLVFGKLDNVAFATNTVDKKDVQSADYHYNPKGKPDPFRPFVEKELVLKQKAKKAATSIFPLQQADIDQYNLVGIADLVGRRIAIVEMKEGKGGAYPLTLGTIIGLNHGKVVEIRRDLIVIEEVIPSDAGRKINRIIKKLHRDEEEGTL